MEIALYEEYPTEANLGRLAQLDFPVDLIVKANSLGEFQALEGKVKASYPQVRKVGYWPTLTKDEGYWFSGYADGKGQKRILDEVEQRDKTKPLEIMLDMESPLLSNPKLFWTEATQCYRNKQRLKRFIKKAKDYNVNVETAENPVLAVAKPLQKFLGETFDPREYGNTRTVMAYTSFLREPIKALGKITILRKYLEPLAKRVASWASRKFTGYEVKKGAREYNDKFAAGLGCLAGSDNLSFQEPLLSNAELAEDIQTCSDAGVNKLRLFRLGGITPEIAKTLKARQK